MFSSYLKTAWRNITRNKSFACINMLGLAFGLSSSLLIFLWINDEYSVDAFHVNGDELYQIYERHFFDGKAEGDYPTQGLLASELKKSYPEIRYATSLEYAAPSAGEN